MASHVALAAFQMNAVVRRLDRNLLRPRAPKGGLSRKVDRLLSVRLDVHHHRRGGGRVFAEELDGQWETFFFPPLSLLRGQQRRANKQDCDKGGDSDGGGAWIGLHKYSAMLP